MPIPSPCIRNCCLDKQDVCIGCGRTLQEIIHWGDAGDDEKRAILRLAQARRVERDKLVGSFYSPDNSNI